MALTLTTSLSDTITKSELEGNFSSIAGKFGAIDNTDIKASAGIAISKLAATKEYVVITLESRGDGTGLDTDDQYRDMVPLPGLSGNENNWTMVQAAWVCTDVGAGSATFDVEWSNYDANGNYAVVSTPIAAEVLTKGSSTVTNAKQCTVDAAAIAMHASLTGVFALKVTNPNAAAMDDTDTPASPSYLKVSLLLERDIQA
jgi:subtilase family serine protease|tara:strand:+ start:4585 stop:5187 length:603 start_codon:yes stop_codon:yes gene_type:complete